MRLDPSLRREAITWSHVTNSGSIVSLSSPDILEDTEAPAPPIMLVDTRTNRPSSFDLQWRPGRGGGSSPIHGYLIRYRMISEETLGTDGLPWQTLRLPSDQRQFCLAPLRPASLYEVEMEARGATTHSLPAMFTFRTGRDRGTGRWHDGSREQECEKDKEREGFEERVAPEHTQPAEPGTHTVPEAPDRPTVTIATVTSAYVTWIPRANGGAPIIRFHVQARRLGGAGAPARHNNWHGDWHTVVDNVPPSKLSVEVTQLRPGATYRFRVSAWNMHGESKRSMASRPYTVGRSGRGPERPVAGPYITYTEALNHAQILLKWMYTPDVNSTPIRGFYVFYRPTDSDNDGDYERDVVTNMKFNYTGGLQLHTISELQAETSYDIKMRVFNDGGESEASNVMICETRARQGVTRTPLPPPKPPPVTRSSEASPGLRSGGRGSGGLGRGLLYALLGLLLGLMALSVACLGALRLWKRNTDAVPPGPAEDPVTSLPHLHDSMPVAPANGCCHHGYGGGAANGMANGAGRRHHAVGDVHVGVQYTELPQKDGSCSTCKWNVRHHPTSNGIHGVLVNGTSVLPPTNGDGLELEIIVGGDATENMPPKQDTPAEAQSGPGIDGEGKKVWERGCVGGSGSA
uniref:Fibronectin type-III domain-containing protein n=1 Tax=Eptatretus burgeri TaxID=7764 RepID=A0A8C4QII1_EPTBU